MAHMGEAIQDLVYLLCIWNDKIYSETFYIQHISNEMWPIEANHHASIVFGIYSILTYDLS